MNLLRSLTRFFKIHSKNNTFLTILLCLAFLVLGIIGIVNHEIWRDEAQAWLIARDSSSLIDLFKNLRYEGHPGLWHLCLYIITRFTHNTLAMQVFHVAIATGFVYSFVKFSPFTKLQKILFCFGYFPFYEYSIISRNYGLGVFLIFLFCLNFPKRHQNYIPLAILLGLLANTNAYCFIIAFCLALTLVFEKLIDRSIGRLLTEKKWNVILSISIFIFGAVIALIQLVPPADATFTGDRIKVTENPGFSIDERRLFATFATIWRSYVPIPNFFHYRFWNTNLFLDEFESLKVLAVLFSLGLFFLSIAIFIKKPVVLFLYLSGNCSIWLFTYEKFFGSVRHHGNLFILFLACVWLSSFYEPSDWAIAPFKSVIIAFLRLVKYEYDLDSRLRGNDRFENILHKFEKGYNYCDRHKNSYLNILLSVHVAIGVLAFSKDLISPFSASREVANFINRHQLNDVLIVGSRDSYVSPISALIDRNIYYPESDRLGSFVYYPNRSYPNLPKVMEKVDRLIAQKNTKILLILSDRHHKTEKAPNLSRFEIFKSQKSIANENYHLYLLRNW